MDYSKLNGYFLDYLNDSRRYAVALQGPWGSGKTRYVEHVLAPLLKDTGYKVLRVSMFGVSDADELYSRIVMALLEIPDKVESASYRSKLKTLTGQAKSIAVSFGAKEISKLGISINATPRMLFDLVCSDKQLIILDDMERTGPGFDDNAVFGSVNDLVEGRGMKVVIVTNDIAKVNAEAREKIIWKVIDFNPTPGELARDVFGTVETANFDRSIVDRIAGAATEVGCINIRAMIKAKPLIEMIALSATMGDVSRAESSHAGAFVEAVGFAFQCASGHPPAKPERPDGKAAGSDWLSNAKEEVTFEHYSSIPVISDYFSASGRPTQASADESLAGFMDRYYPDSPGAAKMKESLEKIACVSDMDEEGAIAAVREFASCVGSADYDISDLAKVVSMAADMRSIGIEGSPTIDEVVSSGKKVIASDVRRAYQQFHAEYMTWGAGLYKSDLETLAKLDSYCVQLYREQNLPNVSLLDESPEAYFKSLERLVPSSGSMPEFDVLLAVDPLDITVCFRDGLPATQLGVNGLFRRFAPYTERLSEYGRSANEWLEAVESSLNELDMLGPVARLRRSWVLQNIDNLKKGINQLDKEDG